jgi:hypothetical protein
MPVGWSASDQVSDQDMLRQAAGVETLLSPKTINEGELRRTGRTSPVFASRTTSGRRRGPGARVDDCPDRIVMGLQMPGGQRLLWHLDNDRCGGGMAIHEWKFPDGARTGGCVDLGQA